MKSAIYISTYATSEIKLAITLMIVALLITGCCSDIQIRGTNILDSKRLN